LDLSGYHWENLGTGYELQRVIDRIPMRRCVLIAEPDHSDLPFIQAQVQRAWSQMAESSPNAGATTQSVPLWNLERDRALGRKFAAYIAQRVEAAQLEEQVAKVAGTNWDAGAQAAIPDDLQRRNAIGDYAR
jgi:hypothetical protein